MSSDKKYLGFVCDSHMKLLCTSHLTDLILLLFIAPHFSPFGCPLSQFLTAAGLPPAHLNELSSDLVRDERISFVFMPENISWRHRTDITNFYQFLIKSRKLGHSQPVFRMRPGSCFALHTFFGHRQRSPVRVSRFEAVQK